MLTVIAYLPNAYATNEPERNEIQLAATWFHQAEAMISLLERYEWHKYSIIVSELPGSDEFVKAAESLQTGHFSKKQYSSFVCVLLQLEFVVFQLFNCCRNNKIRDIVDFEAEFEERPNENGGSKEQIQAFGT